MARDRIYIIGGGTSFHIRPHLALSAPAYGRTAHAILDVLYQSLFEGEIHRYMTRMAGDSYTIFNRSRPRTVCDVAAPPHLETNDDVGKIVDQIVADPRARILFMPVALCDFTAELRTWSSDAALYHAHGFERQPTGKEQLRLRSNEVHQLRLTQADKIIQRVRAQRKDLFLVGFKTTTEASPEAQFKAGLTLLKQASCNLVLANDLHTKLNMVITPEQAAYEESDRSAAIALLVNMAMKRSTGTFTRSTVVEGDPVPWTSPLVPASLRTVVDHCIKRGAYRPFLGATAGHFAVKLDDKTFLTSRRKVDFNNLDQVGLVKVELEGKNKVIAHGSRPSVGGQSQRIIFTDHPDVDCIVHMHCPLKPGVVLKTQLQWPYECGSHQCGQNTSNGLTELVLSPECTTCKGSPAEMPRSTMKIKKELGSESLRDLVVEANARVQQVSEKSVHEPWASSRRVVSDAPTGAETSTRAGCPECKGDPNYKANAIKVVMLDKHGPNIVFNRNVDPAKVIEFIENTFDLTKQTSDVRA